MAVTGVRVSAIDLVRCALPMARPVHVGATVYREREYLAVRIRTDAGIEGHAIGYTRGLPLDTMTAPLARDLLGAAVDDPAAVLAAAVARHRNAAPALARPLGLLDLALHDAAARAAGLPLWRLLGGARDRVPLTAVIGYAAAAGGTAGVVDEALALVDQGFRHLKLHSADPALVGPVALGLRHAGVSLAVDAGMAFGSVEEAVETARALADLGLDYLEDPFPPDRWRWTAALRAAQAIPLAAGEDAAGAAALVDLAHAVDVLRIDPSASGGVGAVLEGASAATGLGARVMTHALPDQHGHLAGDAAVGMVEMIPDGSGVNPVGRLLARRQAVEAGELVLSTEPGHGAPLDWSAVVAAGRAAITLDEHP